MASKPHSDPFDQGGQVTHQHVESNQHSELRAFVERCDHTSIGLYRVQLDRLIAQLAPRERELSGTGTALVNADRVVEELTKRIAELEEQLETLQTAAREVESLAFQKHMDWMHFHELAMADPFAAESQAQALANQVFARLMSALGDASSLQVSSPASTPKGGDDGA